MPGARRLWTFNFHCRLLTRELWYRFGHDPERLRQLHHQSLQGQRVSKPFDSGDFYDIGLHQP